MSAVARVIAAAIVVAAWAGSAQAERLVLGDVHGEADVADEATSVGLLVRSALTGAVTFVEAPGGMRVGEAPAKLASLDAGHAVLLDLAREGTGLRVALVIVGPDGTRDVAMLRAGDGDLRALAQRVVDKLATALHLSPAHVAEAPLGRLRPYAHAIELRATAAPDAAAALAEGAPSTALAVPAIVPRLAGLAAQMPPATGVLVARALADAKQLDAIAAGSDVTAVAAKALAALIRADITAADRAIGPKPSKDGLVALARALIAEQKADGGPLNDRIKEGLATDQAKAVAAAASLIVPARLTADTHRALITAAEKLAPVAGVASRIGLGAAEQNVEVARALALISVRELDAYEVERLAPLVTKGMDVASRRLRAELAMRRGDPKTAQDIATFLDGAPADPRAHLYTGWQLMADGKPALAAPEFEKANAPRDRARALLAAGDVRGAAAALDGLPVSAEVLAIRARLALANNQTAEAQQKLLAAEQAAPMSVLVQDSILQLADAQNDPKLGEAARLLIAGAVSPTVVVQKKPPRSDLQVRDKALKDARPIVIVAQDQTLAAEPTLIQMLEALPLEQVTNRQLAIGELRWEPGMFSFKTTHPDRLRRNLIGLLKSTDLKLVILPKRGAAPDKAEDFAKLMGDSDGVLLYRLVPSGSSARVMMTFYVRGATASRELEQTMPGADLVGRNTAKLLMIIAFALVVIGALVLWLTRGRGWINLEIATASDTTDPVFCVAIDRSSTRPAIRDPATFGSQTRKAGASSNARGATLIASGASLRVPTGTYWVHLYGTMVRSGELRLVPDTASRQVAVGRNQHIVVEFDLRSTLAELHITVDTGKGVAAWIDNDKKRVYTDQDGKAVLNVGVGSHTLHLEKDGKEITRPIQIVAPNIERMAIPMARDLRLMADKDLSLDTSAAAQFERPDADLLTLGEDGSITPPPGTGKFPKLDKPATNPHGRTEAATGTDPAANSGRVRTSPGAQTPAGPGDLLLGRYRIIAELGRGAMGVVHHAWDEKLERAVAVKRMADDLRENTEAMRLFSQEAKALAQLNHTNIVAMYDQVTEDDAAYMIMEFVEGMPLETLIDHRGPYPWPEAVDVVDQALAGLQYAHARKVIHRDIKPANIFVGNDKIVKLGDFGLARVMREVTIRRTEIRGTPLYMAPEQITGTDVDHRSDLYAIGCTLFEALCGRPPFIDGDIMYAQLYHTPPAPSSVVADIPKALDEIVLALMQKKAEDRPASAADVRAMLRRLS